MILKLEVGVSDVDGGDDFSLEALRAYLADWFGEGNSSHELLGAGQEIVMELVSIEEVKS